jgi:glycerophosphoryl diester phosphodiesterase
VVLVSAHDGYPRWTASAADFLEIDLRRARDGTIVLSHDELQPGAVHVTLAEALRSARPLHLDLKEPGYEVAVIRLALQTHRADQLVVTTAIDDSVRAVKDHFPEVRAGLTLGERLSSTTLQRIEGCRADFIAVDEQFVRWFEPAPRPVWVWTVDDERKLRHYMKDDRIEAVISNRPDLALRIRSGRA